MGMVRRQLIPIRLGPTLLCWLKFLVAVWDVSFQSLINDLPGGEMMKDGWCLRRAVLNSLGTLN